MVCTCDCIVPWRSGWEAHYFNCKSIWDESIQGPYPRNEDGTMKLLNPHLATLRSDNLYHLALATDTHDLPAMFGDVKFVCMGGTKHRMRDFAEHLHTTLGIRMEAPKLVNLTKKSQRYAMYKVGPVLAVNHGVGIPSMTIVLQEVIKLLHYAGAKDPLIIRIGTCGGIAVDPGTVVVSEFAVNGCLEKSYYLPILGEMRKFPAILDKRLAQELMSCSSSEDEFAIVTGGTMAADDFYRGQGRLDGPCCQYSEEDKMQFLKKLSAAGVKNIEMEATAFAAMTWEAGVRAADVCVTLLNRINGDQVTPSKKTLAEWQTRPMVIVGRYIAEYYNNINK